tara:strand:+ start:310 stop:729 length:420 start_codon:yes stop_codon:yes gene_type:complete
MKLIYPLLTTPLLFACASNQNFPGYSGVIIDTKGADIAAYEADLADCEALASQVPVDERAATGAVVGAVVGGAVGAVFDGGNGAERGAGVGAVSDTLSGAQSGLQEEDQVLKNCMQGRGYKVLNATTQWDSSGRRLTSR